MPRVPNDVLLAVAVAVACATAALVRGDPERDVLLVALLAVPLAWRRRHPLAVLAAVAGGVPLYLALADPSPLYLPPALVALYTVAAWGTRERTLAVAAGILPYAAFIALVFSPDDDISGPGLEILGGISQLVVALAIGEAVRSQRAFRAEVRESARRAAREHELETRRRLDEERVHIAQDVHDVIAHSLATISTQASVGVHVGREEPGHALEALESIEAVSAQALNELRHALGALRGPSGKASTEPAPTVQDVPALLQRAREAGVAVELRMEGSPAHLSATTQIAIYRIVQEGLTNVMRHAGGARATVRIAVREEGIEVEVSDDGQGTPTAASGAGSGSGLIGMRERASTMGGELEAGRKPDGGFRVRARLPADREPA